MTSDFQIVNADCRQLLATLPADCVDAFVSDPPYGLAFMGKGWDFAVPGPEYFAEQLRVAKPGAHLVAFGGTRTYHRLACAIEDAGWELRDCLMWLYGTGFPKSHNGEHGGTALKPAWEPIVLARKPFKGTVAKNYAAHGVGGLNIDPCRIGLVEGETPESVYNGPTGPIGGKSGAYSGTARSVNVTGHALGRWPANVVLDPEAAAALDKQTGGASRFFYCAKASKSEREAGLEDFTPETVSDGRDTPNDTAYQRGKTERRNTHPTVKPIALMRWLCRLVTPPGGLVVDPFCGSGTTGCAAVQEGFNFLGVELDSAHAALADARVTHWAGQG
ncbi:MAG: site-specific DNA-methyltransferase [Planctomycetota bacterium]|jgi:site-specific DNA-methyltransferase (adenine-specific)|nr:site-specific DNA-methyltransferase [Planctomycetota bacterium]